MSHWGLCNVILNTLGWCNVLCAGTRTSSSGTTLSSFLQYCLFPFPGTSVFHSDTFVPLKIRGKSNLLQVFYSAFTLDALWCHCVRCKFNFITCVYCAKRFMFFFFFLLMNSKSMVANTLGINFILFIEVTWCFFLKSAWKISFLKDHRTEVNSLILWNLIAWS